ncbi:hypothetical protein MBLNU457_3392t1 [Dothideomycetes sp. NU457]
MGASNSKTSPDASEHVFSAESPVRFSQSVVNSLQNSPETDSTRARNQELLIQSRVTSELEKLRDQEASRLSSIATELTSSNGSAPSSDSSNEITVDSIKHKVVNAVSGSKSDDGSTRSSDSVNHEVEALRAKLEKRKQIDKTDKGVEKAKEDLVSCLRMNDRRPLDCWEQVEEFKKEVSRLERTFVERAMR